MTFDIYELGLLLAVTTAVALVCERMKLPYTIGLVLAGLALAALPLKIELPLSKDLVYTFLLPPLVFEAALRLSWPKLRRDLPVILTLAGPGLVASALLLATGMHWIAGWSWTAAGLFGALISATDPVAVIATFDEAKVRGRVDLLESAPRPVLAPEQRRDPGAMAADRRPGVALLRDPGRACASSATVAYPGGG